MIKTLKRPDNSVDQQSFSLIFFYICLWTSAIYGAFWKIILYYVHRSILNQVEILGLDVFLFKLVI